MKKRVVFFSGYHLPHLGGVERYVDKLSGVLMRLGYEVIVITTNHDNLPPKEVVNGVLVYRIPMFRIFKARYPIPRYNKETKEILAEITDNTKKTYVICNTRFHLTTLMGGKWAKKNDLKVLIVEHGSSHFSVGNSFLDKFGAFYEHLLTNVLKRYVSDFYGVSYRCVNWLKHFGINAKGVFYNSVDDLSADKFRNSKKFHKLFNANATVIMYAGRVMKEKGVEMLLDAYADIKNDAPDTALIIAGDGPYLEEARKRYKDKKILFLGKLEYENVMRLLDRADIFCHPSMYPEGLPTSILEAGIMKCAVIATDRGGTAEVINDSSCGIIIDENKEALVKALKFLITDKKHREKIKESLYVRIKSNYTWTKTAEVVNKTLEQQ